LPSVVLSNDLSDKVSFDYTNPESSYFEKDKNDVVFLRIKFITNEVGLNIEKIFVNIDVDNCPSYKNTTDIVENIELYNDDT
jgi:hypothetical protein